MHDIDRTLTEFEPEAEEYEADQFEYYGEPETDGVFDEAEEMELAAGLLEVTDEAELDQFLGDLIKKAGRAAGQFVRSSTGQALGGILKGAASKALPIVGGALGTAIGGPAGAAIGGKLASTAGRLFGLELEGLSPEDQEFEVARRFVRFAGEAVKNAALAAPGAAPQAAAKAAAMAAARRYAPGLLRSAMASLPKPSGVFDEAEEMELAAELLQVSDEAELDQFLGNMFKKIGSAVGKFIKSPLARSLGGMLKGVAKQALPMVGGAIGSAISPGVGTSIGSALGTAASNLLEQEFEGLSAQDQEFEIARGFVRLAGAAAKKAASMPAGVDPRKVATAALTSAARQVAPGLLGLLGETGSTATAAPPPAAAGRVYSGRWIRRGGKIILLGV
ncbi:MAG TPA: hypothetical protein VNN09_01590 [Candidatus Competibacteraceae bacterium]|nr:hypothetical protein [Candidatus Competibacteraceae bacterium]